MLTLFVNSTPITLSPSVSFNLTLQSPIDGEQGGSFVYSFTGPYEPNEVFNWKQIK